MSFRDSCDERVVRCLGQAIEARLTHPIPAVDLDIYLYNSAGKEVGPSTNGSTDELVELKLPAAPQVYEPTGNWPYTGIWI